MKQMLFNVISIILLFNAVKIDASTIAYEDADMRRARLLNRVADLRSRLTQIQEQRPPQQAQANQELCNVCWVNRTSDHLECGHHVCHGCVVANINQAAQDRNIDRARCGVYGCTRNISFDHMRRLGITEEQIARFQQQDPPFVMPTSLHERAVIDLYMEQCTNPRCRRPIEKNLGCNHMTCARPGGCGHEFCWLCKQDWRTHDGWACANSPLTPIRTAKDAEITRRRTGLPATLTPLEIQAQTGMSPEKYNQVLKIKKALFVVALAGTIYCLYKYINQDENGKDKSKNKEKNKKNKIENSVNA